MEINVYASQAMLSILMVDVRSAQLAQHQLQINQDVYVPTIKCLIKVPLYVLHVLPIPI
jgi:hypothetical protein